MTLAVLKTAPKADPFQADFAAHAATLPGAGLAWLDARRAKAMTAFARYGVPTRRAEAWKYTDLASALDAAPEAAEPVRLATASAFADIASFHLHLTNGVLQSHGAAPHGIEIADLSGIDAKTPDWVKEHLGRLASGEEQSLGALSLALMRGGIALRVKGQVTTPVHLNFLNRTASHSRVLVVLEDNASLQLLESHAGEAPCLSNLGIELALQTGARLVHVRLHTGAPSALHVTSLGVSLARDAQYRALYASLGGKLSRLDANVNLSGHGAEANLRSVAALGEGIADITTVMDHASPHTTSRQLFKNVVGGHGRAVTQGRVTVREGAGKSDSHQLFKSLLLSPRAEADSKPELEIYADDVVCGHGTAIGALDADALFYLRARGIPEREARGLLIRAFLEEVLDGFAEPAVHAVLWARLDAALAALDHGDA